MSIMKKTIKNEKLCYCTRTIYMSIYFIKILKKIQSHILAEKIENTLCLGNK